MIEPKQYSVQVSLIIKADSAKQAHRILLDRLSKWFNEPGEAIAGYGFPAGTLLHYHILNKEPKP